MKNPIWTKAIKHCAEPERARHVLNQLQATNAGGSLAKASEPQAAALAALFSGSQALSGQLIAHPEWFSVLEIEALKFARRKQGLEQEVNRWLAPTLEARDFGKALGGIREFKEREMLRIGTRDLARLGSMSEVIQELSDAADICLKTVWEICRQQLIERYGRPFHQDATGQWQPTAACVVGLGKLGGQELNYSSDVDVIIVYSDEGSIFKDSPPTSQKVASVSSRKRVASRAVVAPRPVLANHQFFNRLAEAFIAEVTRLTSEGTLYRIDLRLRPEGDSGPLSRSLSSFENYYAQWGQTWERMMLIKAREVADDETLAAEFLEMVQSFRYPRSINENVLREVGAMKDRIENEVVKSDELERNVKLGFGGIREIEFVVQALQLLHAGRQPFLQGAQTLASLEKLTQYELLPAATANSLREAYTFWRMVEHRLQMENNRQTHTIPAERHAQLRLARLMGFKTLEEFDAVREAHARAVRRIFDQVLKNEVPETHAPSAFPTQFDGEEEEWKQILGRHGFKNVDASFRVLREFVEGPGYVHVSPRTRELALHLLERLLAKCPSAPSAKGQKQTPDKSVLGSGLKLAAKAEKQNANIPLSDPDRVVTRLDSFISAYGARGTLFELWNSNPAIFELLVLLFDRSEFLAELAIRTPDLVDELVTSGRLRQRKSAEETLRDLSHGLSDADQHLWLRRYHQAELMRIGLRDILGLADFEQYLTELSALADACLRYALKVAMRHHKLKTVPFVVIGLGKLGGREIDYGSDLDIIFVAEPRAKNLTRLKDVAIEMMELLTRRTELGLVFHTDARLRPDGEKGLLVNTLDAYESYYRSRAHLWEIQTLTRSRPIAGDLRLGQRFQTLAAALTNFARPSLPLIAYQPDWKSRINQMRMRIEKERTPAGKDSLAIKTGSGGLVDAEFIAQALCLEHGWQEANTVNALEKSRGASVLPDPHKLIDNYRRLRRVEGILRRWSYEGETVLPDEPAPYYRVSVRCGFPTPEAFREVLAMWRRSIREVYQKVFRV